MYCDICHRRVAPSTSVKDGVDILCRPCYDLTPMEREEARPQSLPPAVMKYLNF